MKRKRSSRYYDPGGPAVLLADSGSLFPKELAMEWQRRGLKVSLVTSTPQASAELIPGVPIVDSRSFRRPYLRAFRAVNPLLRYLERKVPEWNREHYRSKTGRIEPEPWEWYWVDHFWDAFSRARAALALRPRFVFGHEAHTYGFATAMCRGVPRVIFPWGADIFNCAECSPAIYQMIRYAFNHADLIVPSSTTAAHHIPLRFKISADKVHAVSWGVDHSLFTPLSKSKRIDVCRQLGIEANSRIVLNVRRFQPLWGAFDILNAFLALADLMPNVHFVLFGGSGCGEYVGQARETIRSRNYEDRFTLLEGNVPLEQCARIMAIADVFLSLIGRGDMRSASVIQAAAAGGVPLLLDAPEYRIMEKEGFAAEFVSTRTCDEVCAAIRKLITDDERRRDIVAKNAAFLRKFEDRTVQMTKLLSLIDSACQKYQ